MRPSSPHRGALLAFKTWKRSHMLSILVRCSGCVAVLGLLGGGCAVSASGSSDAPVGVSAARLSVDLAALLATTDVTALRFTATRVSCSGEATSSEVVTSDAAIEDLALPVMNPELSGKPLAPDSNHVFADKLVELEPGCYDISLNPLAAGGGPSSKCAQAKASHVQIFPEATTEIVLVSQCQNPAEGAGDFATALNEPPSLSDLANPRFVDRCQPARVCITASDPDQDPIEFVWSASANSNAHLATPVVNSTTTLSPGVIQQCVSVVAEAVGTYQLTVSAYDEALRAGVPTRIEDLLQAAGTPAPSHSSVTFSFVANDAAASTATTCD